MAELLNGLPTNLTEYPNSFKRQTSSPLDMYSVFYSKSDADNYAQTNGVAYVGQPIAVVENNSVVLYVIENAVGNLKPVGTAPVGDDATITVTADGIVSIKGASEATEGQQLRIVNKGTEEEPKLEVEWFTPDIDKEYVDDAVEELSSSIDLVEEKVEQAASIAKGKNQAKVFDTEQEMLDTVKRWYCIYPGMTLPEGSTIIMSTGGVLEDDTEGKATYNYYTSLSINDEEIYHYLEGFSPISIGDRLVCTYVLDRDITIEKIEYEIYAYGSMDEFDEEGNWIDATYHTATFSGPSRLSYSANSYQYGDTTVPTSLIKPLDISVGDNLYIRELDKPDYWWDGSQPQKLETQKVDLTNIPGQKVENGGEIFNDYTNNVALGEFSHAEGKASVARTDYSHSQGNACIAGGRGFKIPSKPFTDSDSGKSIIVLDSVVGLEVDDIYSMKFGNNFIDFGNILEVYPNSNSVVVDKIPTSGMNASTGVFWIGRKQLGTDLTKVAFRNSRYEIIEISASAEDFDAQVATLKEEGYTLLGCGTILLDSCQHAEGTDSVAVGYAAHAEGNESIASGRWSHAEGNGTYAGYAAHSEGNSTKATGEHAHAEGGYTEATAGNAHAEGYKTKATAAQAHAAGQETTASGKNSTAIGYATKSTGHGSLAVGNATQANGTYSIAAGTNSIADAENSVAIGINAHAQQSGQIVVGRNNAEDSNAQFIVGIGEYNNVRKNGLVVKKDGRVSAGATPTDEMDLTTKEYVDSALTAAKTILSDNIKQSDDQIKSSLVGKKTGAGGELFNGGKSAGKNSHAEGNLTIASGEAAHAEGYGTTASGNQAHAEGHSSIASGDRSHAEGWKAEASGIYTHAEGFETKSTNWASHAEGNKTVASGAAAHAEGSLTTAKGGKSHAGGQESAANGDRSFVHGSNLIAEHNDQTVFGQFNDPGAYEDLFIIGNGNDNEHRANAFVVHRDGTATIQHGPINSNDVANKEYVDDKLSPINEDLSLVKSTSNEALSIATRADEVSEAASKDILSLKDKKTTGVNFDSIDEMYDWINDHRIDSATGFSTDDYGNDYYVLMSGDFAGGWVNLPSGYDEDGNTIYEDRWYDVNLSTLELEYDDGYIEYYSPNEGADTVIRCGDRIYSLFRISQPHAVIVRVSGAFLAGHDDYYNVDVGKNICYSVINTSEYTIIEHKIVADDSTVSELIKAKSDEDLLNATFYVKDNGRYAQYRWSGTDTSLVSISRGELTNVETTANIALNIAKGKNQARVFDTEDAMKSWLTTGAYYSIDLVGKTLPAGSTIVISIDKPKEYDDMPSEYTDCIDITLVPSDGEPLEYGLSSNVYLKYGRLYYTYVIPHEVLIDYISFYFVGYNGSEGYGFTNENERVTYTTETITNPSNIKTSLIYAPNIFVGDNLYIRELNKPDYWFDGETQQQLETQKVDLTEYATKKWVTDQGYLTQHQSISHKLDRSEFEAVIGTNSIKIGDTTFTEEQLIKILNFIDTISFGGNE